MEEGLRLSSDVEDLDLPTFNRVRLSEPGGLEASFVPGFVPPPRVPAGVSGDAATPAFPPSSSLACALCLPVLSEAFLPSRALFPRSAERRLSLCRRALLKKDRPFSSDLPPRCASLAETLGERRLVTEELLLELLTDLLSGRAPSPLLEREARDSGLPRSPSAWGLACTESLLQLLSTSRLRPVELLSGTPGSFFAVGDGDAEDWGVERTSGLRGAAASPPGGALLVLEGVPQGVEVFFLALAVFPLGTLSFLPFTGEP